MKRSAAMFLLLAMILPAFFQLPLRAADTQHSTSPATNAVQEIVLQGRVVCLAEEMAREHGAHLPTGHEHVYGLRTSAGDYYTLLRTKYSEAIFADARVRDRELRMRARLFPRTKLIEVMNIKTVRKGVVHDLYYYCAICHISMVAPSLCECCQGETELTETPLAR